MKKSTLLLFSLLITLLSVFSSREAKASHCAGGQLTYVWVSDSTYKFTLKFYRDCSGSNSYSFDLCYYSACAPGTATVAMTQVGSPTPVVVPCFGTQTTCENPSSLNQNYQEVVFEATVVGLSKCANWRFYTTLNARNPSYNLNTVNSSHILCVGHIEQPCRPG